MRAGSGLDPASDMGPWAAKAEGCTEGLDACITNKYVAQAPAA